MAPPLLPRIDRIALHCYAISPGRLAEAARLTDAPDSRYLLDTTGYNTKIVRADDANLLMHAYVARRVICAGRLLMLFERLRIDGLRSSPVKTRPDRWTVEFEGAVVQVSKSVGGGRGSHACHTAPCQVRLAGHYPWRLSPVPGLQQAFVAWFGDIYVMPTAVNRNDSFIESRLRNRELFAEAVAQVLRHAEPLDVLAAYIGRLSEAIASSGECRNVKDTDGRVLRTYLEALPGALALAQRALPPFRADVSALR